MSVTARAAASLLLIGLIAAPPPHAAAPRPSEPDREEPQTRPAPAAHLPRFEVSISHVANLVHWIDNLAGTSRGKTIRVYRQYWEKRFGFPSPEEVALLRDWARIRGKDIPGPEPEILNESGCLPQMEEVPTWRRTFLIRSYEAGSVDAFIASMSPELNEEERSALRRVIEAFRPRFDQAWQKMEFLRRFEQRFRTFLAESGLRSYLGRMASFFGVDPDLHPPGRIHLIALPAESATHAQADGPHLQMEIRPNDTPVEQIQVIAHETAHYLWNLAGPARNDAFARQVFEATPAGPVVWELMREGLPTALGQGLAEATLAPERFGEQQTWYHVARVDRFAKDIFPVVAAAFQEGRRLEDGVLAQIAARGALSETVRATPPTGYIDQSFFAVGEGMFPSYRRIREEGEVSSGFASAASSVEGAAFAGRYACLSGVVLLGPSELEDPSRIPPVFAPPGARASAERSEPAWPGPSRSSVMAVRRPGGGIVFILTAARESDAATIGDAFLDLSALPASPLILEAEPRP